MKRLPAQIGILCFSVLAAAYYLSETVVIIIGAAALVLAVIFFAVGKVRKTIFVPAMAVAAALACAVNLGYTFFTVRPCEELYGNGVHTVKAVLKDESYHQYSKYYYRLKTTEIDGDKAGVNLILKTPVDWDAEPDDVLTFTAALSVIDSNYYRSKGYYLKADDYDTVIAVEPASSHSPYYYAVMLRQKMREALNAFLPEDAASLCRTVLIGDKYAMNTEVRDQFRSAGASYFIVVSGMHFAVICTLLMKLLKRMKRWVRFVLLLFFILLYAAITGFQPSVLRSAIMMTFMILGDTIRRQTYPLNHLGIAGLLLPFIVTPYGAGDIGLILSFYATMSILLWAGPIADKLCLKDPFGKIILFRVGGSIHRCAARLKQKPSEKQPFDLRLFLKKSWNALAMLISVSLAANILVFPISVFVFRGFSPVTLLSAVLLYPEIYLILILSLAVCILYWLGPLRLFALWMAAPLKWCCQFVLWLVKGLASLPFSYCYVSEAFFDVWLIATIVMGVAVLLYRNRYRYLKYAALCSLIILLSGGLLHEVLASQVLSLEIYSCKSGMCVGINDGGTLYLLRMDADSESLYQVMKQLSGRYGGAQTALCCEKGELRKYQLYRDDEFAISDILMYDRDIDADSESRVIRFDTDSDFILSDEITLSVSTQNGRAVPYLTAGGQRILMVPYGCRIEDIPAERRKADIIVLYRATAGMEELRCEKMILTDSGDFAEQTAEALRQCYQHICYSDGDICCRLR